MLDRSRKSRARVQACSCRVCGISDEGYDSFAQAATHIQGKIAWSIFRAPKKRHYILIPIVGLICADEHSSRKSFGIFPSGLT